MVAHFFRFWLWLTTGMVTKEWVAIHRKHHAKVETADDPHSPQTRGIKTVLLRGAELYRDEAKNTETLAKYGHGTPDDWIERNLYTRFSWQGVGVMLVIDLALFGPIGATIWAVQMLWIPVTAAGIINGIGHYWGYRNFACTDASTNIVPWGIIIGGEELHNNHHAYGTSAKLSSRWYEFDIGWMYIRMLETLKLATVRKVAPQIRFDRAKAVPDLATLQAIITHRYAVATELRGVAEGRVRRRDRRAAGAPRRTRRTAEPAPPQALDRRRRARPDRERTRAPRAGAGEQQGAPADLPHAPGAGAAVGPVDRIVRAAARTAAGLVPSRRSIGHRAARAVLAAAQAVRVVTRQTSAEVPRASRRASPRIPRPASSRDGPCPGTGPGREESSRPFRRI